MAPGGCLTTPSPQDLRADASSGLLLVAGLSFAAIMTGPSGNLLVSNCSR